MQLTPGLRAWITRVDALTLKERVLVLAAVVLTVLAAADSLLLQPLDRTRAELQNQIEAVTETLAQTERLTAETLARAAHDPDAEVQQGLTRNRAQQALVEAEIKARIGRMVPPEQMAQVLERVLSGFDRLQFVGLEGLGVEPLVESEEDPPTTPAGAAIPDARDRHDDFVGAYRHGLRIRFSGSYLDTLAYLRALEQLPWGFFWDSVELETGDYPETTGSIVVYTLSLQRGWIGV